MKLQTILFDLDGTLIDPKMGITESVRFAMMKMARPLPPETDLDWCIGPPLQENFARLLESKDRPTIDTAVAHFRTRFSTIGLFEATVYDDIPEMLDSLKSNGFRLLLATSKAHIYAHQILAHFSLADYFDEVYGSELDGRLAAKADLIRHILHNEQLDPHQTIMVGDREHDILGARVNDVTAVGVCYGYGRRSDLVAAGTNWLIHTPNELLDTIAQIDQ